MKTLQDKDPLLTELEGEVEVLAEKLRVAQENPLAVDMDDFLQQIEKRKEIERKVRRNGAFNKALFYAAAYHTMELRGEPFPEDSTMTDYKKGIVEQREFLKLDEGFESDNEVGPETVKFYDALSQAKLAAYNEFLLTINPNDLHAKNNLAVNLEAINIFRRELV